MRVSKQQARALQAFIIELLEPPMEPKGHPLPDVPLSPREIKVLLLLGDKGEVIMTDLATALHSPLSTVTRVIDRLEKKGLVERFRSNEDRRIVVVHESEKGRMLHQSFRQLQLEMAERMLEPLTNGEREILIELLAKVAGALKAAPV